MKYRIEGISLYQGLPSSDEIEEMSNGLIVIDDLMHDRIRQCLVHLRRKLSQEHSCGISHAIHISQGISYSNNEYQYAVHGFVQESTR